MGSRKNGRSSASGASWKGKKGSMEMPKHPQRGLGVAQLEKMRIQSQIMSDYCQHSLLLPSFPANLPTMGYAERSDDICFVDTHYIDSYRFYASDRSSTLLKANHLGPVTLPLMEVKKIRDDWNYYVGSISSETSYFIDSQELDLELKLSI